MNLKGGGGRSVKVGWIGEVKGQLRSLDLKGERGKSGKDERIWRGKRSVTIEWIRRES